MRGLGSDLFSLFYESSLGHIVLNSKIHSGILLIRSLGSFIGQSFALSLIIRDCKRRGRNSSTSPAGPANVTVSLTVTRQNTHCIRTAVTGQVSLLTGHHGSIWQVVPDECHPSLVNVMARDTFHRPAPHSSSEGKMPCAEPSQAFC